MDGVLCQRSFKIALPMLELKVQWLKKLKVDVDPLLGGQLVELGGGGDPDPLGRGEHAQLLLLRRAILCIHQSLHNTRWVYQQNRT